MRNVNIHHVTNNIVRDSQHVTIKLSVYRFKVCWLKFTLNKLVDASGPDTKVPWWYMIYNTIRNIYTYPSIHTYILTQLVSDLYTRFDSDDLCTGRWPTVNDARPSAYRLASTMSSTINSMEWVFRLWCLKRQKVFCEVARHSGSQFAPEMSKNHIRLNILPYDSFVACFKPLLGYSTWQFQALQQYNIYIHMYVKQPVLVYHQLNWDMMVYAGYGLPKCMIVLMERGSLYCSSDWCPLRS